METLLADIDFIDLCQLQCFFRHHLQNIYKFNKSTVDSEFPRWVGHSIIIIIQTLCQKLLENEGIWTEEWGGIASLEPPSLGSATPWIRHCTRVLNSLLDWHPNLDLYQTKNRTEPLTHMTLLVMIKAREINQINTALDCDGEHKNISEYIWRTPKNCVQCQPKTTTFNSVVDINPFDLTWFSLHSLSELYPIIRIHVKSTFLFYRIISSSIKKIPIKTATGII